MNRLILFLTSLDAVLALPRAAVAVPQSLLQPSFVPIRVLGIAPQNSPHGRPPQCGTCMRRRDATLCWSARVGVRSSLTPMELAVSRNKLCTSCILQQDIASCQSAVSTQISAFQLHATQEASRDQVHFGNGRELSKMVDFRQEVQTPALLQYGNGSSHQPNQSTNETTAVIEANDGTDTQDININVEAPAPVASQAADKVEVAALDSPGVWLLIASVVVALIVFCTVGPCRWFWLSHRDAAFYKIDVSKSGADLDKDIDFVAIKRIAKDDEALMEALARIMAEAKDHIECGWVSRIRGDILFSLSLVSAAMVPVLVANIGTFGADTDRELQVSAVILSVTSIIAKSLEDVYDLRRTGDIRINAGKQMMEVLSKYLYGTSKIPAEKKVKIAQQLLDIYRNTAVYDHLKRDSKFMQDELQREFKAQAFKKMVRSYSHLQSKVRRALAGDSDSDSGDEKMQAKQFGTARDAQDIADVEASQPAESTSPDHHEV